MQDTDFNSIIQSLISSTVEANAIYTEQVLHDSGFQLTIRLDKISDED